MRRGSIVVLATLLASALIVVFGVIAINQDSRPPKKQQNKKGVDTPNLGDTYVGNFGEVSGDGVLAAAILRKGPVTVGLTAAEIVGSDRLSMAAESCAKVALGGVPIDLLATGTLNGERVAIIVASKTTSAGAQVAFVTNLDQCVIIYSERL